MEPSTERLVRRQLEAARDWLPHQFVPWSAARDFDGPLEGAAWTAEQSALPQTVRDALIVNLLTEDNLPSYHLLIATRLGREGAWGTWVHRWTAEEDRHSAVLRAYVHARRAVDPASGGVTDAARGSRVPQRRADTAASAGLPHGPGLATRQAHRNTGAACGDPVGEALMARIAADENLHMLFYRGLLADALQAFPDETVVALTDVLDDFSMPGFGIPGFRGGPRGSRQRASSTSTSTGSTWSCR